MSDDPGSLSALLDRVIQGDEQAAQKLFDEYREALILCIRRRLRCYPDLRRQFDSIDFLQEVWRDVFAHPEKLRDFGTFTDFLRYLQRLANHQIEHARRKYLDAQKRDLRRECSLSDPGIAFMAAIRTDPGPDPAAQLAFYEMWFRWLRSLSKRQQSVVIMLRKGLTYSEIAERMNCSVRTIERTVAELRAILPPQMSHNSA